MDYFFQLMRQYAEKRVSLEDIWGTDDIEGIFPNFKTLYRYHNNLIRQIDDILRILSSEIIALDTSVLIPDILPGEQTAHHKLQLLFFLLDSLVEIFHRKNIFGILLHKERYRFLHAFLYQHSNIILLDSS